MDIYVISRGITRDYYWSKITNQGQSSEEQIPPIADFNHLINANEESLSLVLSRSNGKLSLYITGLKTNGRKDKKNRFIRNSVLWIGENSEDESVIRALIVQALRDELAVTIDNVVKNHVDGGFNIIESEYSKLIPPGISGKTLPDKQPKIGNLKQRKKQLADEITDLTQFPQHDGILVVITNICDKSILKNTNVWRGLSSQIHFKNEEWNNADIHRTTTENNIVLSLKNFYKLLNRIPTVVFVTVAVLSLTANLILLPPFISIHIKQENNTSLTRIYQKCQDNNLHLIQAFQDITKFEKTQKDDLLRYVQKQINESEIKVNSLNNQVTSSQEK